MSTGMGTEAQLKGLMAFGQTIENTSVVLDMQGAMCLEPLSTPDPVAINSTVAPGAAARGAAPAVAAAAGAGAAGARAHRNLAHHHAQHGTLYEAVPDAGGAAPAQAGKGAKGAAAHAMAAAEAHAAEFGGAKGGDGDGAGAGETVGQLSGNSMVNDPSCTGRLRRSVQVRSGCGRVGSGLFSAARLTLAGRVTHGGGGARGAVQLRRWEQRPHARAASRGPQPHVPPHMPPATCAHTRAFTHTDTRPHQPTQDYKRNVRERPVFMMLPPLLTFCLLCTLSVAGVILGANQFENETRSRAASASLDFVSRRRLIANLSDWRIRLTGESV
jgi:hypothetical protein